ncbi:MAG: class I SAM-dependent rRNA methyltransferase [Chitinophagales bacterium]
MSYSKIILKPKKAIVTERKHPFIFSGAIAKMKGHIADGDIVEVFNHQDEYLATGHFQKKNSISVRLFSFEQSVCDVDFWAKKIEKAWTYRQTMGFKTAGNQTNAFRLINAEGDGMSGLIADFYNGVVVLQCHSLGMYKIKEVLAQAFQQVMGDSLQAIYDKSADLLRNSKAENQEKKYLFGEAKPHFITENDLQFWVDWEEGQKTGFFIDQRDNRLLLKQISADKKVLNMFSYSGGFSINALKGNAEIVHSVDSSKKAIFWLEQNEKINGIDKEKHTAYTQDAIQFLKDAPKDFYDIIILDPPAYAKSFKARHRAVQAYKRLNAKALQIIKKGGFLLTFSCSGVVDQTLFNDTIRAAAIEVGRPIRIIKQLGQAPDHAVNIFHKEGHYLKGLWLYVE